MGEWKFAILPHLHHLVIPRRLWLYLQTTYRKIVETTGSLIERLLPKSIHSVTAQGFELKLALFVLATSINFLG